MITGAQAMVKCLEAEGIENIFGYPGAAILPFYEALSASGIQHILTRTEQGAGHAASGYARITGKPAVCVSTSGPGATNLFTALATAYSDSIPMVAITGQVRTEQLGHDVFQEIDTTGAAEPFTKYAYLLRDVGELPRIFKEAFHIAATGRPGPVLIDVPIDIQQAKLNFSYPQAVQIRGYKPCFEGHPLQIRRLAAAISKAKRPLVCCGGGVLLSHGAIGELKALCEEISLPAVSTMMGLGALEPEHPLNLGMLGQAGFTCANTAIAESDLLIILGARIGDRAIMQPSHLEHRATIAHIDIDTAEIGKNVGAEIPIVGDVAQILSVLRGLVKSGDWQSWLERLSLLKSQKKSPTSIGRLDPNTFLRRLNAKLPDNAIYAADVGQNQIWSARNFTSKGRFLTSGGMGTMGYSIPAAIGAALAAPSRMVFAVCGDGSFQISLNELATLRQHNIPLKIIVMRNNTLGMISELYRKGIHFACELDGSPNIALLAQAYGLPHRLLSENTEIDSAVDWLIKQCGACILECEIASEVKSI